MTVGCGQRCISKAAGIIPVAPTGDWYARRVGVAAAREINMIPAGRPLNRESKVRPAGIKRPVAVDGVLPRQDALDPGRRALQTRDSASLIRGVAPAHPRTRDRRGIHGIFTRLSQREVEETEAGFAFLVSAATRQRSPSLPVRAAGAVGTRSSVPLKANLRMTIFFIASSAAGLVCSCSNSASTLSRT